MCAVGAPADRLARIPWLKSEEGRALGEWFVLHVKSRQEKALADDLTAKEICNYLPLISQIKYYGGRKFSVDVPLFAGYLFLKGTAEETYAANRTGRVANILRVIEQQQLGQDLQNIYIALTQKGTLNPYPYLREGIRVEVRSGPFRGLQGVIRDAANRNRLILQVEMLGKAVSLEIDSALLDPID